MLANPERAVEFSKNMFFEKVLLYSMGVYTFILMNDCISIVIQTQNSKPFFGSKSVYEAVCRIFLSIFDSILLFAYAFLYVLFIRLIARDKQSFGFMQTQVHSFFIFMLLIQLGRLIVGVLFKHKDEAISQNIEYFNVATEAIFNLAILYYFVEN